MSAVVCAALTLLALVSSTFSAVTGVGGVLLLSGLLLAVPATAVVPLHGAVQLVAGGSRVVGFRHHIRWDVAWRFIAGLIPGSLLGLAIVAWLAAISPGVLKGLIATAILLSLLGPKNKKTSAESGSTDVTVRPRTLLFTSVGALCGTLAILVGSTGPIVTQTLLAAGIVKEEHIATKSTVQAATHLIKIPIFGIALSFDFGAFALPLALMMAAVVAGTYLGKRLLTKVSPVRFVFIARALLFLVAVQILVAEAAHVLL